MRLSDFKIKMIWLVGLISFTCIAFSIEVDIMEDGVLYDLLSKISKMLSIVFLLVWSIGLSETLRDIVALKYKIVNEGWQVEVKYLTFFWLLIPYWKPIEEDYHSYEAQNLFGAKWDSCYATDKTYKSVNKAKEAIERHKEDTKRNRYEWFKTPKKNTNEITYM